MADVQPFRLDVTADRELLRQLLCALGWNADLVWPLFIGMGSVPNSGTGRVADHTDVGSVPTSSTTCPNDVKWTPDEVARRLQCCPSSGCWLRSVPTAHVRHAPMPGSIDNTWKSRHRRSWSAAQEECLWGNWHEPLPIAYVTEPRCIAVFQCLSAIPYPRVAGEVDVCNDCAPLTPLAKDSQVPNLCMVTQRKLCWHAKNAEFLLGPPDLPGGLVVWGTCSAPAILLPVSVPLWTRVADRDAWCTNRCMATKAPVDDRLLFDQLETTALELALVDQLYASP